MTNVRLGVNMNPETAAELKHVADTNNITITEAVRRCIAIGGFVERETRAGAKVQIVKGDLIRDLILL